MFNFLLYSMATIGTIATIGSLGIIIHAYIAGRDMYKQMKDINNKENL